MLFNILRKTEKTHFTVSRVEEEAQEKIWDLGKITQWESGNTRSAEL